MFSGIPERPRWQPISGARCGPGERGMRRERDALKKHDVPYSRGSKAADVADRRALDRWRAERKKHSSTP